MDTDPQPAPKLALLATIAAAYRTTFAHLASFGLVVAVWGTLAFSVLFAVHWLVWRPIEDFGVWDGILSFAAPLLPSALIGASAAVVWHRLVLRGEEISVGAVVSLDGAVLRYAGLVLALVLATLLVGTILVSVAVVPLVSVLSAASPSDLATASASTDAAVVWIFETPLGLAALLVGGHLLFAPVALVAVRLMLRLPAIAVGANHVMLQEVWQATRGNSWRLYLGSAATIAPTNIGMLLCNAASEDRFLASLSAAAAELIWLAAGLVFVSFMSLAYRHFFPVTRSQ